MKRIKVIQFGLGPIGNIITKYLVERNLFEITAAVDIDPLKSGKDIGTLAGLDPLGVTICGDAAGVLDSVKCDIAIVATQSRLQDVKPLLLDILSEGRNVITTCEELVYPWFTNHDAAEEIDRVAKLNQVSVLSTGANPGFMMDYLPVTLTSVCQRVDKITIERYQNALFRRESFQQKIGAGLDHQTFRDHVKQGRIRHIGLTESVHYISSILDWKLTHTDETIEPVPAREPINVDKYNISKGMPVGMLQTVSGYINEIEVIKLIFKACICERHSHDKVIIKGQPSFELKIDGGVNGDIATCGIIVNLIPAVLKSSPGLKTMADMSPVSYIHSGMA